MQKTRWLNLFTWLGILLTIGLALVPTKYWQVLLLVYIGSIIGYSGGNLFYDSFLIDVADNKQMDRVSVDRLWNGLSREEWSPLLSF